MKECAKPKRLKCFCYEIFLNGATTETDWQKFLQDIAQYLGRLNNWRVRVQLEYNIIHYYIISPKSLPLSLAGSNFLLKPTEPFQTMPAAIHGIFMNNWQDDLANLINHLAKRNLEFRALDLNFIASKQSLHGFGSVIASTRNEVVISKRLLLFAPAKLLSIDFTQNANLNFKKTPKYLKLDKALGVLSRKSEQTLLEVDTFPYQPNNAFLSTQKFDFDKHSLILGGSGVGKSKLIALLIQDIAKHHSDQYKIVIIDPHDNIKNDLLNLPQTKIINFQSLEESIDLFKGTTTDLTASVELTLDLFQLLLNNYNGRLERVLRFSSYLLIANHNLSFLSLRQLLTDSEYRNQLVSQMSERVPTSITQFFLTDYNEIRNQSYGEAIAPIIAFIDEMQIVPVFSQKAQLTTLQKIIDENFLSIFSLNRLNLGNKVTQTIAGLLMQQLFLLAQDSSFKQHLLVIVDEMAAIENPIMARFLSELRKYHASLILSGQYFEQVSENLRASILANVANYYIFRVSKTDASLITQSLEMKIVGSESQDDAVELLTHLKDRECITRISRQGEVLPAFRAKTMPCETVGEIAAETHTVIKTKADTTNASPPTFDFTLDEVDLAQIMQSNSTSRKKLK